MYQDRATSLLRGDCLEEVADCRRSDASQVQIMYGICGERNLAETELAWPGEPEVTNHPEHHLQAGTP